jgi:hemerythrin-like domain-containing protein
MTQILARLHQEHVQISKLLDLLDDLLAMFHARQEPDYEILSELLQYMEDYSDQIHHPTEEVIRERLRLAGQNQPYLDVLTRQHEVLNEMTRNFRQAVEGVVNGEVQRRDQVEAYGREMIATLRAHLDLEEKEAFPLARQVLTEDDWAAIKAEVARTIDPRLSETDLQRIRAIVQHLTSQVRV